MNNSPVSPKEQKHDPQTQLGRAAKKDFLTAIVVNAIFIAVLIGLYFYNRSTGILDSLISRFS